MSNQPRPYLALALQTTCHAVNGASSAPADRARIKANIERIAGQLLAAKGFLGPTLQLVVLPEYVLTGFPQGEDVPSWQQRAALEPHGPEWNSLGVLAQEAQVYLAGNAYEIDEHFPELYFQGCFVFAPSGERVLRYRRLISLYTPTPYDIWERYLACYGEAALFPVVDTPLGRIAAIASEEILYPEIARALALRGAEVLVHSSSEVASALPTPKHIARQARAIENMAYVVSANTAGIEGIGLPAASTEAGSAIIEPRGMALAVAGYGETIAANALIDLRAQRELRARPGMGNLLSRQPLTLWRSALGAREIQAPGGLLTAAGVHVPARSWFGERQHRGIEALHEQGII